MKVEAAQHAQDKLLEIQRLLAQLERKVPKQGPNWVAIEIHPECEGIRRLCHEVSVLVGTGDSGMKGTGFQGTGF